MADLKKTAGSKESPSSKTVDEMNKASKGDVEKSGTIKSKKAEKENPSTSDTAKSSKASPQAKPGKAKSKKSTTPSESVAPDASRDEAESTPSLLGQLKDYTNRVTAGALDVAKAGAMDVAKASSAMPQMFSNSWVKDVYTKSFSSDRISSMVDAGKFLQDAREVAGLNIKELSEAVGIKDSELLENVENGKAMLPFDVTLRIASLVARHDPVPMIMKFVRTYNPELESKLDQWGVSTYPKQYERERRFINVLRKYDQMRDLSDEEFERLVGYQESAMTFALEIMATEKDKNKPES